MCVVVIMLSIHMYIRYRHNHWIPSTVATKKFINLKFPTQNARIEKLNSSEGFYGLKILYFKFQTNWSHFTIINVRT